MGCWSSPVDDTEGKGHGQGEGWSGGLKVSCILRHQGVQLILAYSWARPAILVAGKGRGGMFFSSPELKAQGELLWSLTVRRRRRRPYVRPSVRPQSLNNISS